MKKRKKPSRRHFRNNPRTRLKDIFYAAGSGILLSSAFTPADAGFLAWIALIPFFIALHKKTLRRRVLLGFVFGYVFFLCTLWWLIHVSLAGLLVLCLYLSLYYCVFAALNKNTGSRAGLFFIPLTWTGLELARSYLLTGFGWALLGYSQFRNIAIIQTAEVLGVYGLSFLAVMVNAALAQYLLQPPHKRRSFAGIQIAFIFLLLGYGYGAVRLQTQFPAPDISVSVIQANIPQEEKWDENHIDSIIERFSALTREAAEKDRPHLIVWPETSVPGYLLDEPELLREITALIRAVDTPLLAGSPREDESETKYYNAALLFDARGELLRFHDKIHLVPFGEYVPHKEFFRFLDDKGIADFSPGSRYTLFTLDNIHQKPVRFAALICFEDIFPWLVRRFRARGAEFFVLITNEAWFKISHEPIQHLAVSVLRAVENRAWFVRCANTGISCFIDPHGRIHGKIKEGRRDIFISGYQTLLLTNNTDKHKRD